MVGTRTRAAAGSCLGSALGGLVGIFGGVYVWTQYAESLFGKGVQGPILISFLIGLIASFVEFGIAAAIGGLVGSILGAMLGTVVSTLSSHKNAEPAHPRDPPGPGEPFCEALASEPHEDVSEPTIAHEQR